MDEPGASRRSARYALSAGGIATGLVLLLLALLVCVLVLAEGVRASNEPPAYGDWVVEVGEFMSHTGRTLDVHGDLHVYGSLSLYECQLWLWSTPTHASGIVVHPGGALFATHSGFGAGDPLLPFYIDARQGSTFQLTSCGVTRAGISMDGDGSRSGVHVATGSQLADVLLQDCLVGLWVDGATVTLSDYSIVRCRVGVAVTSGGRCTMFGTDGVGLVECGIGALVDASDLFVSSGTFLSCREGLVAYSSRVGLDSGCTITSTTLLGVGVYGGYLWANDTAFNGCVGDAVVVHTSDAVLQNLTFSSCTNDIRLVSSEAWTTGTVHTATDDAAIDSHLSTFHIDGARVIGSYWGLRAHRSSGECANMTTSGVTFSVQATMCEGLRIEGLHATGTIPRPDYSEDRGLYVQDSDVTVVGCTLARMRNGLYLDGARGLVDNVTVADCTREGVIVRQSSLTLRGVNVTNATDGFLLSVYSHARLEGCEASYCRAAGFNVTSGASDALVGCTSTGSVTPAGEGAGIAIYLASPKVIDCTIRQYNRTGSPLFMTWGIDCLEASPRIDGGEISGAGTGIRLAGSSAVVSGVTFHNLSQQCIFVDNSSADEVRGCTFVGQAGCVGVVVGLSSPLIEGNTMRGLSYGVLAYNKSKPRIVGNLIEHIEWDGVLVYMDCTVELAGNTIRDCLSNGLTVAFGSRGTSRGDSFELSGASNVYVHTDSSLDIEGSTMRSASMGLHGQGARSIRVAFCEFRDNNQGMRVGPETGTAVTDVRVEGCYFTNHSSYCIGAIAVDLAIVECTFLDNIAGIHVWDATSPVSVLDCTIVAAWLYGLTADNSLVEWTVQRSCRLVDADVTGHVSMQVMAGARLEVVGSRIAIQGTGCLWRVDNATLRMQDVQMAASGGCAFRALGSDVTLLGCALEGLGSPGTTQPREMGMVIESSALVATGVSIRRSEVGLILATSTATLVNTTINECLAYGLHATASAIALVNCTITRVTTGTCLYMISSTMDAERSEISLSRAGLELIEVDARLSNCSIGGFVANAIDVSDGVVVLLNTTHDVSSAAVRSRGVLEAWWYVSARVVWANATELPSAVVTVVDGSGRSVAQDSPGEDGRLTAMPVLAYVRTEGGVAPTGPHTVSARLHGFNASRTLDLTSSVDVELRLLDEVAPAFDIVSPSAPVTWSRSGTIEVFGHAVDAGSGTRVVEARLDYGSAPLVSQGASFTFTFRVASGQHVIELRCEDWALNEANTTLVVNVETTPLALAISYPVDGSASNATTVEVSGLVSRAGASVRVNGAVAVVEGNVFHHVLAVIEGPNTIRVEATDAYGHRTERSVTLLADRTAPGLKLTSPRLVNTTLGWVTVRGNASLDAELTINDVPVLLRDGAFDVRYPVGMGESLVIVRAVDAVGNAVEVRVLVDRLPEEEPPRGPDWWEAVPFVILLPLLMAAEWFVIVRPDRGEGEGGA